MLARKLLLAASLPLWASCASHAYRTQHLNQADGPGPRILCVVAHPDDEIAFAGTLFKAATHLDGVCDVLVITNGEGGFKYSTLAEHLYGLELTDERVGRRHLPDIRAQELADACSLLGVRRTYHLEQRDHRYTQDVLEVLGEHATVWDLALVRAALREVLMDGTYDFVLTLAPTSETHGHHKAAALLALEAVQALPAEARPVVLCARTGTSEEPSPGFAGLEGYPVTRVNPDAVFVFDRTQGFGYRERLTYEIVVNWAIAAHKSQGTMQLFMGRGRHERYFLFDLNARGAVEKTAILFEALGEPQFATPSYDLESVGGRTETDP